MAAKWYKTLSMFLTVLMIINIAACSAPARSSAKVALVKVARDTPQSKDQSLVNQQVEANNAFAFDLYHSLRQQDGNLFYSPYSISMAVAMAYAGARGETEKQISTTMHYVLPQEQLHAAFNNLDQSLNASGSDKAAFQLNVVNSVWGQDQFPFLPDFLTLIARNYGAGVRLVDFKSNANREAARKTINDWVSQQTNDKIKELLPQGMLNDLTRLILVNAIYFKGEWQDLFGVFGAKDAAFTLLDGQQVNVPTMSRKVITPYVQGDGYQAIALHYKGDRVEMIIVMPDAGTFSEFEQTLDQQSFDSMRAKLENRDLDLSMPKFQFEYSQDMAKALAGMGMPAAFDAGQADFSGIYDQKIEPNNLFISHVAHKAFVAVDEKGTEAAAATDVVIEAMSLSASLSINHPFIFVIRDNQTGSILFVGRVLDPRTP